MGTRGNVDDLLILLVVLLAAVATYGILVVSERVR
jgi:hypothetical protein